MRCVAGSAGGCVSLGRGLSAQEREGRGSAHAAKTGCSGLGGLQRVILRHQTFGRLQVLRVARNALHRAHLDTLRLVEVTDARASVGKTSMDTKSAPTDPAQLAQFEQAQQQLSSALSRLLVVVERYPDLKSSANFLELQAQLEGTENRITVARRDFNDAVQAYNTAVRSFPAVFYAGALGFKEKPYFSAAPGAENAPKVQFDFNNPAPAPAKP